MAVKGNYWVEKRTIDVILASERRGALALGRVLPLYQYALNNVRAQITDLYRRYSNATGIDVAKLKKIIEGSNRAEFLRSVKGNLTKLGINFDVWYSAGHIQALTNLEAFKERLFWEIMAIAPQERDITGQTYAQVVQGTYGGVNNLIAKAYGMQNSFGGISNHTLDAILNSEWAGRNFSTSVWGNTNLMAKRLPELLGGGILAGESYEKTSQRVRQAFGVGAYEAKRLVLTETAYYAGQGELQSYKENVIEKYVYSAILDTRTSKFCDPAKGGLGGQVFNVADAVVGLNYPPLHPFCRSTTYAVLPDFTTWLAGMRANSVPQGEIAFLPTVQPVDIAMLNGGVIRVNQNPLVSYTQVIKH